MRLCACVGRGAQLLRPGALTLISPPPRPSTGVGGRERGAHSYSLFYDVCILPRARQHTDAHTTTAHLALCCTAAESGSSGTSRPAGRMRTIRLTSSPPSSSLPRKFAARPTPGGPGHGHHAFIHARRVQRPARGLEAMVSGVRVTGVRLGACRMCTRTRLASRRSGPPETLHTLSVCYASPRVNSSCGILGYGVVTPQIGDLEGSMMPLRGCSRHAFGNCVASARPAGCRRCCTCRTHARWK